MIKPVKSGGGAHRIFWWAQLLRNNLKESKNDIPEGDGNETQIPGLMRFIW